MKWFKSKYVLHAQHTIPIHVSYEWKRSWLYYVLSRKKLKTNKNILPIAIYASAFVQHINYILYSSRRMRNGKPTEKKEDKKNGRKENRHRKSNYFIRNMDEVKTISQYTNTHIQL